MKEPCQHIPLYKIDEVITSSFMIYCIGQNIAIVAQVWKINSIKAHKQRIFFSILMVQMFDEIEANLFEI